MLSCIVETESLEQDVEQLQELSRVDFSFDTASVALALGLATARLGAKITLVLPSPLGLHLCQKRLTWPVDVKWKERGPLRQCPCSSPRPPAAPLFSLASVSLGRGYLYDGLL